ncbi:MAG: metallophosphoesterase family protein [Proteobacteria bacterium]|nr:metallophosphoesterase family protein [Pseudomonadota bacterium]
MLDLGSFTKVALFGGTYNNWIALEATVADAKARGAQAIVFLGDAGGFGPHPNRTVERLRNLPIHSIQGNYDDSVGNSLEDCQCGYVDPRDNQFAQISYDYTLQNTHADHRRWLRALPTRGRLQVGDKKVLLCHGSPRRVNEFLWESTTPAGFIEHLCNTEDADLIACTHTGIHWERRLEDGRGVLNVGAIGRPPNDGQREVWYSMLELDRDRVRSTFVPVSYDWKRLAAEMDAEGLPAEFSATIRTGWWTTCLEILPGRERARGRF